MKKTILTLLSFLFIGSFCFADNTGEYKKIISANADNQDMFAELNNTLEQEKAKSNKVEINLAEDTIITNSNIWEINPTAILDTQDMETLNQQNIDPSLLNTYPEFIQTCMEKPLLEALKKNPKLTIKNLTSDRDYTKTTFTLTAVTTTGQKIKAQCENKGAIILIMDLWDEEGQANLKNYRGLHQSFPLVVKNIRNYIYEKTGKQYDAHIPFQCDNIVEVYDIISDDSKKYWTQAECMPVIYRLNKSSNKVEYAVLAFANLYPIYLNTVPSERNMVKVNDYPWYGNLTPRSNPPSFNPKTEYAPIPHNDINIWWFEKLYKSESDRTNDKYDSKKLAVNKFMAANPKGTYIPNNGILPIIKINNSEINELTGINIASITDNPYQLGYYCGQYLATTYKDTSTCPASWRFYEKKPYESTNFIPNKSLNCKSFNKLLIQRLTEIFQ